MSFATPVMPRAGCGRWLVRTAGVATILVASSAGCLAANDTAAVSSPAAIEINIGDFAFSPREVVIPAGATVTWINRDDSPHTVAETRQSFRSGALDTGDRFSHTFPSAGVVDYFCTLHPHMTGRIVVR